MEELKKKIRKGEGEDGEGKMGGEGLGFDKLKVEIKARPAIDSTNPHRLEGVDELP